MPNISRFFRRETNTVIKNLTKTGLLSQQISRNFKFLNAKHELRNPRLLQF